MSTHNCPYWPCPYCGPQTVLPHTDRANEIPTAEPSPNPPVFLGGNPTPSVTPPEGEAGALPFTVPCQDCRHGWRSNNKPCRTCNGTGRAPSTSPEGITITLDQEEAEGFIAAEGDSYYAAMAYIRATILAALNDTGGTKK